MKATPSRSQVQQQRIRGISAADYIDHIDQTPSGRMMGQYNRDRGGGDEADQLQQDGHVQQPLSQRGTSERRSFFLLKTPITTANEFEWVFELLFLI
jgi:hypothetical protein